VKRFSSVCALVATIALLAGQLLFAANGASNGTNPNDISFKLLDAQSATDANGVWVPVSASTSFTIQCSGLESGGAITIRISNAATQPANSAAEATIALVDVADTNGAAIATISSTANKIYKPFLSGVLPIRWIKATKAAGGTPAATTVIFNGQLNK